MRNPGSRPNQQQLVQQIFRSKILAARSTANHNEAWPTHRTGQAASDRCRSSHGSPFRPSSIVDSRPFRNPSTMADHSHPTAAASIHILGSIFFSKHPDRDQQTIHEAIKSAPQIGSTIRSICPAVQNQTMQQMGQHHPDGMHTPPASAFHQHRFSASHDPTPKHLHHLLLNPNRPGPSSLINQGRHRPGPRKVDQQQDGPQIITSSMLSMEFRKPSGHTHSRIPKIQHQQSKQTATVRIPQ
ncbi:hypothetical protein ACLOJK_018745 [Asimina triloba]